MEELCTEITWINALSPLGEEVHVYGCDIETLNIEGLKTLLSSTELTKAVAFRQPADANRFIAGRGITKKILGYYAGTDARQVIISPGKNGKPIANIDAGIVQPNFNISHSGNKVLIAFCNQMVGIDVELVKEMELESMAELVFSEREHSIFRKSNDPINTFYYFWTRKEALLKTVGVGLTDHLSSVDMSEAIDTDFVKTFTDQPLGLLSFTMQDHENYFASLCYVKNTPSRFIRVTNELLSQL